MFTRCPSCRAAFSITQQQLEIAAGVVRCGMCEHVFDAKLYLFNQALEQQQQDESELTQQNIDKVDVELTSSEDSTIDETNPIDLEVLDRELDGGTRLESNQVTNIVDEAIETTEAADIEEVFQQQDDPVIPKIIADQVSNLEQEPAKVTPMQWLGSLLVAALIGLVGLQAVAAIKTELIPSQYQTHLCKWLRCTLITPRAVNKIEVLNRSIHTHPTEPEALMVTLTIINRADFSQPYPVIQLRFLNISGNVIAARRFTANHYLHENWQPKSLMTASTPLSIQIEVHDVGEEVVSYDFDFL